MAERIFSHSSMCMYRGCGRGSLTRDVIAAEGTRCECRGLRRRVRWRGWRERLLRRAKRFARAAFEKDVSGFSQDADGGVEDQQADGEAEERIDPVRAGIFR